MSVIPIDEAGIEVAYVGHGLISREDVRFVVAAYLGAVGAEVELDYPDDDGKGVTRIVTPWKPLTDTEEGR